MAQTRAPKEPIKYLETPVPNYTSFTTVKNEYQVVGEKKSGGQGDIFPCKDSNGTLYVAKVYRKETIPSLDQRELTENISDKKLDHILPVIDSGRTRGDELYFQIIPYMQPLMNFRISCLRAVENNIIAEDRCFNV